MKLQDISNLDKNDFLGILGLETKHSLTNRLLGTVGTFGIGVLVGAGVALLLAPKTGSDLRHDLRTKLHCDCKDAEAKAGESGTAEAAGRQA
jgi:gas vesicle protein